MMPTQIRAIMMSDVLRPLLRFHSLRTLPPNPPSQADLTAACWESEGTPPPANFPVAQFAGMVSFTNLFALPIPGSTDRQVHGLAVRYVGYGGPVWLGWCPLGPLDIPAWAVGALVNVQILVNGYGSY